MASTFTLTPLEEAKVTIISGLGDEPNTDDGLSAAQLKAKFDEGGKNIRTYLNGTLIAELQTEIRSLEDATVGTAKLVDGAVTTAKLGTGAVTETKLGTDAVATAKIADSAVTAAKIADGAVSTNYTGIIQTTDWQGSAAPYYAEITVSGLLSTDIPIVDAIMSGTWSTDEAREEAWSLIYRAVSDADTITFYAKETPTVALPFSLLCVRK